MIRQSDNVMNHYRHRITLTSLCSIDDIFDSVKKNVLMMNKIQLI